MAPSHLKPAGGALRTMENNDGHLDKENSSVKRKENNIGNLIPNTAKYINIPEGFFLAIDLCGLSYKGPLCESTHDNNGTMIVSAIDVTITKRAIKCKPFLSIANSF